MPASGAIDLSSFAAWAIAAVAAVAVLTDLRSGRIPNWLTLPALGAGLVFSAATGGWQGLGLALLAVGCALVLLGWMFAIRVMGGGDVKLLMALSAWSTPKFAVESALLSVLLGGLMAVVILLVRGRMGGFVRKMHAFILSVIVKDLELATPKFDRNLTMPYGVAIAAAAVWTIWAWPLRKWVELPWS